MPEIEELPAEEAREASSMHRRSDGGSGVDTLLISMGSRHKRSRRDATVLKRLEQMIPRLRERVFFLFCRSNAFWRLAQTADGAREEKVKEVIESLHLGA